MRSLAPWGFFVVLALVGGNPLVAQDVVPTGKLSDDATPLSYVLNLKIDPRQDGFSGQTRIRVRLAKAADHLWLHGQDLQVKKVEVTDASGKVHKAAYLADKEGVAKIAFDGTLAAQEILLSIDYF
jgi:alanyl aminopeptidase